MKKKLTALFVATFSMLVFAQSGSVGINTPNPTEILDVNGIERVRLLPEDGSLNAIHTKTDGTKSIIKDQPFNAVKTIVADNNGVLGAIMGVPRQNPVIITGVDGKDAVSKTYEASAKDGVAGSTPSLVKKSFVLEKNPL
nr:hypothetical protein [uncultured Chryseobacterium sp.]